MKKRKAGDSDLSDEKNLKINNDPESKEHLVVEMDWRKMFPPEMVKKAESSETIKKISNVTKVWGTGYSARYYPDEDELNAIGCPKTRSRRYGADQYGLHTDRSGKPYYEVSVYNIPQSTGNRWEPYLLQCSCTQSRNEDLCIHKAALLAYLEKKVFGGKYLVRESDYDYEVRQRGIKAKQARAEEEKYRQSFPQEEVPALDFFADRKEPETGLYIYDMKAALQNLTTDAYSMDRAREIMKHRGWFYIRNDTDEERTGEKTATVVLQIRDSMNDSWFDAGKAEITGSELTLEAQGGFRDAYESSYNFTSSEDDDPDVYDEETGTWFTHKLNIYELVLCSALWDYCDQLNEETVDLTDDNARKFFRSFDKAEEVRDQKVELPEAPRIKAVQLYPRIIMEYGNAELSFRIEQSGHKRMVVKNLNALAAAYNERKILQLSKKESIDFDVVQFTDHSMPLYDFISRRIGEVHDESSLYRDHDSDDSRVVRTIIATASFELKGALLDGFYDAWNGNTCEYNDKSNGVKEKDIPVGHRSLKVSLQADEMSDARGTFAGVEVTGLIPVMLKGSGRYRYTLNANGLSRITEEERKQLKPFDSVSDSSGYFRMQVGKENLQEFYYRIVPSFLESPVVSFDDHCEMEVEKHLPPEPVFDFWLDCQEDADSENGDYLLSAKAEVSYVDHKEDQKPRKYLILEKSADQAYRDDVQEKRVDKMLSRFFPKHDNGMYSAEITDEQFFDFLTSGIGVLEKYGTVHGTEAFRVHHVRQAPVMKFGVSVDSGIMDLTLTSDSLSKDELLDVMNSYHQRKRFHRLKSGDYLDLTDDHAFEEIQDILNGMDLSDEEVIKKSAHVPLYRALYLDKLLERHQDIVSSRDRVYRGLIRSFHTLNDSEMEPPESLEKILRPYQVYGYKWIRTLETAGFGGILADEMGLGKTLQMISVLLDDYQKIKPKEPSLVVCPASLVYNWQEEFQRFAPVMKVVPVAGGAAMRRKAMESWDETQVYIISYDLLKRNIAEFANKNFWYVVLDEAQYIKNAGAAVSRSVKTLKAKHRFALTGTPIENRLSELWSIFDFLMPGFLYGHKEFERKFETPITKNKDEEAAAKLKNMTSPFILRRRKEDVLKDLPEKMEEVRYVQISGKQQKLYDAEVLKLKGEINESDESNNKIAVFAELTKIREICCDPSLIYEDYDGESAKRTACMDLIRQAMDGGHRMLVFSQFTSMLALLEKDLKDADIPYYILTGSTSKEKRIAMVHDFNSNDVPVFLISLKAGGTGLNLTGADVVIHYDPWWNLAAQNQATDRTHRIGQTKQVTVYKLIMKNTIEDKILDMQEAKKDLAESVLEGEGKSITSLSKEELLELLD